MTLDPTHHAAQPRRFRRSAITSVLWALTLGATTTVAIAWALAFSVDTILYPKPLEYGLTPGVAWNVQPYACIGVRSEAWSPLDWATRMGDTVQEFDSRASKTLAGLPLAAHLPRVVKTDSLLNDSGEPGNLIEHARGLPFLALGCATVLDADPFHRPTPFFDDAHTRWGLILSPTAATWDVDCIALPLKPLFPGFYLDTVLYASLWWAALFWRPLRRRRRIARGQCPTCAYSLAGLPPGTLKCPECGSPAPKP